MIMIIAIVRSTMNISFGVFPVAADLFLIVFTAGTRINIESMQATDINTHSLKDVLSYKAKRTQRKDMANSAVLVFALKRRIVSMKLETEISISTVTKGIISVSCSFVRRFTEKR